LHACLHPSRLLANKIPLKNPNIVFIVFNFAKGL